MDIYEKKTGIDHSVDFDFANHYPSKERALFLRHRLNSQLLQGLDHLLTACNGVVDEGLLRQARHHIQQLDVTQPISPLAFLLQFSLLKAIQNQDVDGVHLILDGMGLCCVTAHNPTFMGTSDIPTGVFGPCLDLLNASYPVKGTLVPANPDLYTLRCGHIRDSLTLLRDYTPDFYDELTVFQNSYLIMGSDVFKAGSSFYLFGLAFLRDDFVPTLVETVDVLVHESAHLYLYALQAQDPLVLNPAEERYDAPLRADKRPMVGIFHAAFVLGRMIAVLETLLKRDAPLSHEDRNRAREILPFYHERRRLSLDLMKEKGVFTPLGQKLIETAPGILPEPPTRDQDSTWDGDARNAS